MKLKIAGDKYWIKDGEKFPSNFDSMDDYERWNYILDSRLLHRLDGPAVITYFGTEWWLNGKRHRIDGPAMILPNEFKLWFLNDIEISGETYQKIQNSPKEELLVYMIDSKYRDYLPLIEYRLSL